jgi:putative nucleotidyltransferase with HDIG domain
MKKTQGLLLIVVMVVTAVAFMLYSLNASTQQQIQLSKQKILQEAIAHFDNMVITRSWNARYGGVYVKPIPGLKPNPYLKNNTLQDAQGNTLIKINPAWMTRQISELSNQKSRYYYKITSLKPVNPHNAPDAFEKQALQYFDQHPTEKYYSRLMPDNSHFDFMGALKTETECLNCHVYQGYKIGDIRGGIRVSIPTDLLRDEIHAITTQFRSNIIFIFASATTVLIILFRLMFMLYQHQQKIEKINQSLEKTVQERTHSLEQLYRHEKYIKDLLKTVASVNELLLASMSIQSALKSSAEELAKHPHYRFTWVGMVKDDLLEVAHKSNDNQNIIAQTVYSLHDHLSCQTGAALEAITQNRTIIKPCSPYNTAEQNRRASDYMLHWLIAIPLNASDCEQPFGVFNVYSDREAGFEPEEVNVLERLSVDIGLILHSHKQKAILEKLELERVSNYEETILAFVNIIEQRDTYTAGHTLRVAEYCKKLATALQIDPDEIKKLEQAAILHDIGKVATPDSVLLKPGKLTALEYELIKQHAYAGFNMLSKIDMYQDLAEIIRYHHVRYDGHGYPLTYCPDDVPFLSHIMAVADAFDAMTTNRIYKPKQTVSNALAEIERLSGSQFHPRVVAVAVEALKDIQIAATSQIPSTELEQKRFSYFFEDVLTGLHNESYLQIILSNMERKQNCLYLICLSNFSQYNKKNGWEQGNQLLVQLARALRTQFPQALTFRYHGDDFVLLFESHAAINKDIIETMPLLSDNEIGVSVNHLELEHIDYDISSIYDKFNKIKH